MTIDIESILSSKFKGKKLPKFIIRWIKKFIHEDEINHILSSWDGKEDFFAHAVRCLNLTIDIEGLENVPDDGTLYTFASNHPLGGADGVILASVIVSKFGNVGILANDFLSYLPPLKPHTVPVNKTGSQSRSLSEGVNNMFKSDRQVLMFPAGVCSRMIDGKVQDLPWTKTFITKSVANSRPIVPVHFVARNSKRFYTVAKIRKFLGIKFNVEMCMLPDEFFRTRNSHFTVKIAEPIPCSVFDKSKTAYEWAAWVRESVYNL